METIEQLIREYVEEVLLHEKGRRMGRKRRASGRMFKPDNITNLLATRIKDPLEWRTDISNAMAQSDGRVPDAADKLGVSTRTLYRNLEEPTLRDVERAAMGRPPEDEG